jgi:hypothetical protein
MAILWNQQRCSLVSGKTSRSGDQNPSAPSSTASTGARLPRRAASRSRSGPRPFRLPVAVGQRSKLLRVVRANTDQHGQAELFFFEEDIDVHSVGPHVDVFDAGQVTA